MKSSSPTDGAYYLTQWPKPFWSPIQIIRYLWNSYSRFSVSDTWSLKKFSWNRKWGNHEMLLQMVLAPLWHHYRHHSKNDRRSRPHSPFHFFSSWTLFKLTGRTWQNVFVLSSLARKVLGHDNFSHGFLIEESHQSWELTHETLRGGKFFPPKLMPAVIDTLVEISFVNKPGGRCSLPCLPLTM